MTHPTRTRPYVFRAPGNGARTTVAGVFAGLAAVLVGGVAALRYASEGASIGVLGVGALAAGLLVVSVVALRMARRPDLIVESDAVTSFGITGATRHPIAVGTRFGAFDTSVAQSDGLNGQPRAPRPVTDLYLRTPSGDAHRIARMPRNPGAAQALFREMEGRTGRKVLLLGGDASIAGTMPADADWA